MVVVGGVGVCRYPAYLGTTVPVASMATASMDRAVLAGGGSHDHDHDHDHDDEQTNNSILPNHEKKK